MKKRKNGLLVWIVFAIIIILAIFCIFYFTQLERKKEFDNLYSKDYYLRVNYGVIESKGNNLKDLGVFLKEKNIEKNYYLYITKDNKNVWYIDSFDKIIDFIKRNVQDNDLVITIGAGPINEVAKKLAMEEL